VLLYVGFHSFTTCFGLHGHLQGCRCYCMSVSTVFDYMAIFKCVEVIVCWFPLYFTTCFGLRGHLQVIGVIACWFPLSFTTCFGLHGHLQVCRSYCMLVSAVIHYMAIFKCVAVIVCWFPLSFTTCFGLHGHLQVCRSYCMLVSTVFHYMFQPKRPSSGV
jgi:hypothetical protein